MHDNEREPPESLLESVFSPALFFFIALAIAAGSGLFYLRGADAVQDALSADVELLSGVVPRMCAAVLIAGFIRALVPPDLVARWAGAGSGVAGLVVAAVAGMLTPGGPISAFSLIAALRVGGADRGVLVAYALGWALLGVQRIMVWEIPLLGSDFALLRLGVSAVMPIVAGAIARRVPIDVNKSRSQES